MAATDYDVIIGGTKAKIAWNQDGAFRRRFVRQEITQQILQQSNNPVLTSRPDKPGIHQSSWAGGARWWKPLITPQDLESYFQSNHFDVWSRPGKVVPMNKQVSATQTDLHKNMVIGAGAGGAVYAVGSTNAEDSTNFDVYVWTPGSDDFVRDSGVHSGVDDGEIPMAMVFDPSDGYFYVVASGNDLERFNPGTNAENANWITSGFTVYEGTSIMRQNGYIMLYDGEKLYTVDKAVPSVTAVYNDGMGPDMLAETAYGGTQEIAMFGQIRLAISTPEGIYYVKNTREGGSSVPFVFRVDLDASGAWIGVPITTLPRGTIAMGLQYHMGQLVVSTASDSYAILNNDVSDTGFPEIVLYFVGEGGMGVLGSMLGPSPDEVSDESPFMLLGSEGPYLYIGGYLRLYVYDAVRGGLHSAMLFGTSLSKIGNGPGVWSAMFRSIDSADDAILGFLGSGVQSVQKGDRADNPDTVTNFGDDETHYALTSNFFDAGLPMELKELSKVEILREAGTGGQEWTVQVSADGAAFADALVHSTSGAVKGSADLSGTTGYQFQYRLIYQTKTTARNALKAVQATFQTGQMIEEWDMLLDGSELLNINNEVQDEQAFFDAMVTLAGTEAITTLVDNVKEQEQLTATSATQNVKVMAVEIIKTKPGESLVRVVVRED